MIRFIAICWFLIFSTSFASSQSVLDLINNSHKYDMNSTDVTVFAFAYSRIKEADSIMQPMLDAPSQTMDNICKKLYGETPKPRYVRNKKNKAIRWAYINHIDYYMQILQDIQDVEKQLKPSQKSSSGPISTKFINTLKYRLEIMQDARRYDWSTEFVMLKLEENDLILDQILIDSGNAIASAAYDTLNAIDLSNLPSVSLGVENVVINSCLQESQDDIL